MRQRNSQGSSLDSGSRDDEDEEAPAGDGEMKEEEIQLAKNGGAHVSERCAQCVVRDLVK